MKNFIRLRTSWAMRFGLSAVALAASLIGSGGIASSQAHAAAGAHAHRSAVAAAQLVHGVLVVRGTPADDRIALRLKAGDSSVLQVDFGDVGSADFSFDRPDIAKIAVLALPGDDAVRIDESNGVFTDSIPTTLDGGPGNDTIAGGSGAELITGGPGNDTIDGNHGNDVSALGAGDDVFVWDPGDGSDVIEGQGGTDTMVFNGAAGSEQVDLSANGNHLKFFRNPGNVTMDTHDVERVVFNALGGADVVTVNNVSATDVNSVDLDLGVNGSGDGQPDHVVVNGTNRGDAIDVSGDAQEVKVGGLAATIRILHPEAASDRLDVNTLAGNDTVDTVGLAPGSIKLFVDGTPVP